LPKVITRNTTQTKKFDSFEKAIAWSKKIEAAGPKDIVFESLGKGKYKVYW